MEPSGHIPKRPTFEEFDLLERKPFALRLESFLLTERHFVPNSLVISLNACFGSGKTTFLEMWKGDLEKRHDKDENAGIPIMLNAWESDYAGEPIMALLDSIDTLLRNYKGEISSSKKESVLKGAVLDTANFIVGYGNSLVSGWGLGNPQDAGDHAQQQREKREAMGKGIQPLEEFRERKDAFQKLKVAMADCFKETKRPVFIFIDELDRCRPDYAVTYLETIKHLFDTEGLIFVLGVDLSQLECSTRVLYGDINFSEYFRKFCHRVVNLPESTKQTTHSLCYSYFQQYITACSVSGIRHTILDSPREVVSEIVEFVESMNLSPRQTQELFRIFSHLTGSQKKLDNILRSEVCSISVLMTALFIGRKDVFQRIVSREIELTDIPDLVTTLFSDNRRADWWRRIFVIDQFDSNQQRIDNFLVAVAESGVLEGVTSSNEANDSLRSLLNSSYRQSHLADVGHNILGIVGFADTWG